MNRMYLSVLVLVQIVVPPVCRSADEPTVVETKKIWKCDTNISQTDLVRFKDAWYCVFNDRLYGSSRSVLRLISSSDGVKWEIAADVTCRSPSRGDSDPRLSVTPNNELMLIAMGNVPVQTTGLSPAKNRTHTTQAWSWTSKDGRNWDKPAMFCENSFRVSSLSWHKGELFSFSRGCICGNATTLQISGRGRGAVYKETPSYWPGPGSGSLVFSDDVAYCLMPRNPGYRIDRATREYYVYKSQTGLVSSSMPPFSDFSDWKDLGVRIANPNAILLPDGRIIASVGLFDKKKERTSLCWFDRKACKLKETLELPVGRSATVGLAQHDGQLWITYHKQSEERSHVYLIRVKLATDNGE